MDFQNEYYKDLWVLLCEARKHTTNVAPIDSVSQFRDGRNVITYSRGDWLYREIYYGESVFSGEVGVLYKDKVIWTMHYRGKFLSETSRSLTNFCLKTAIKTQNPDSPLRGPKVITTSNGLYRYDNSIIGNLTEFKGRENVSVVINKERPYLVYQMVYSGGIIK